MDGKSRQNWKKISSFALYMLPQISPRQAIWKTPMMCKRNIQSWISWLSKKYLPKNSRRFFNFKFYLLSKLVLKETVLQSWNNIPFNIFSENCERKPSFQMQIKRWGLIKQMCHHPLFSFSTNHEAMKGCSNEFQMSIDRCLKLWKISKMTYSLAKHGFGDTHSMLRYLLHGVQPVPPLSKNMKQI